MLAQSISVVVREKHSGHLVAFLLNKLEERATFVPTDVGNGQRRPGWLVAALTAQLEKDVNLFDLYQTDRVVNFYLGVVRSDYRKRGLSKTMARLSTQLVRSLEPPVGAIKTIAVNHYAGRHPANKLIKSVDYETFQMADGSRPLSGVDLGVHKSARLLARPLLWSKI